MHLWSDSPVILAWISSSPHRWQQFVSHRIAEIQNLVPDAYWNYIPGEQNPWVESEENLLMNFVVPKVGGMDQTFLVKIVNRTLLLDIIPKISNAQKVGPLLIRLLLPITNHDLLNSY